MSIFYYWLLIIKRKWKAILQHPYLFHHHNTPGGHSRNHPRFDNPPWRSHFECRFFEFVGKFEFRNPPERFDFGFAFGRVWEFGPWESHQSCLWYEYVPIFNFFIFYFECLFWCLFDFMSCFEYFVLLFN